MCALLAALSTLLALLYALAMGATTLLHDVLDGIVHLLEARTTARALERGSADLAPR